jgi:hypothetical protein
MLTAALAGSLLTGGALGATVFSTAASNAATTTTAAPAAGSPPANGTFKSNETSSHEAGESAAREAQENAGMMPTVP